MLIKRVTMEPELEEIAGTLPVAARRQLAKKLRRWAHELEVSADVMARDDAYRPAKNIPRLPAAALKRN
jgi:hypothetical protein